MLLAQILTVCIAYGLTLKKLPEFNFSIRKSMGVFKISVLFILIISPQIFSYIYAQINSGVIKIPVSIILILILVIIVPFYEEVVFRGCLFGFLCSLSKRNVIFPALITSAIFCSMHMQSYDLTKQIVLFFSSLILIYARVLTKGLIYPFVLHSSMNATFLILNMQI